MERALAEDSRKQGLVPSSATDSLCDLWLNHLIYPLPQFPISQSSLFTEVWIKSINGSEALRHSGDDGCITTQIESVPLVYSLIMLSSKSMREEQDSYSGNYILICLHFFCSFIEMNYSPLHVLNCLDLPALVNFTGIQFKR